MVSREQIENGKLKEQTLSKEIVQMGQESEKKNSEHQKIIRKMEKDFNDKEEDWKIKIKGLEKVFETLQGAKNFYL